MALHHLDTRPPAPRWDGSRVMFTVVVAGRRVHCGISRGALQEACGPRHMRDPDFLPGFERERRRIEAIAVAVAAIRPEGVTGMLHIWADDVTDPPSGPAASRCALHAGHG